MLWNCTILSHKTVSAKVIGTFKMYLEPFPTMNLGNLMTLLTNSFSWRPVGQPAWLAGFVSGRAAAGERASPAREWSSTRLFTNPLTASPFALASLAKQKHWCAKSCQLRRLPVGRNVRSAGSDFFEGCLRKPSNTFAKARVSGKRPSVISSFFTFKCCLLFFSSVAALSFVN